MKTLSGEEAKAFADILKKAVAQATNGKGAVAINVRVSGRQFGDGSQGIGFICYNLAGEQFTLIRKVPAELMTETKAQYRDHLKRVANAPGGF